MKPVDATHKALVSELYYKESDGRVYVWGTTGEWIESIGGPLKDHLYIFPIPTQ